MELCTEIRPLEVKSLPESLKGIPPGHDELTTSLSKRRCTKAIPGTSSFRLTKADNLDGAGAFNSEMPSLEVDPRSRAESLQGIQSVHKARFSAQFPMTALPGMVSLPIRRGGRTATIPGTGSFRLDKVEEAGNIPSLTSNPVYTSKIGGRRDFPASSGHPAISSLHPTIQDTSTIFQAIACADPTEPQNDQPSTSCSGDQYQATSIEHPEFNEANLVAVSPGLHSATVDIPYSTVLPYISKHSMLSWDFGAAMPTGVFSYQSSSLEGWNRMSGIES